MHYPQFENYLPSMPYSGTHACLFNHHTGYISALHVSHEKTWGPVDGFLGFTISKYSRTSSGIISFFP